MADLGLPGFLAAAEAILDPPLDVELIHITALLRFPQRDQDDCLVTQRVTIHKKAGRAPIILQDVVIAPGLILIGDGIVLQVADPLSLLETRLPAAWVKQFQDRLVLQDFVHPAG